MQKTAPKLWYFYALILVITIIIILCVMGMDGILHAFVLALMGSMLLIVSLTEQRHLLKRRTGNTRETVLFSIIAFFYPLTVLISVLDFRVWKIASLHGLFVLLGLVLVMSSYFIVFQSLTSDSRHAKEKYGEPEKEGKKKYGPYDVIRHPVMLAALLFMLGIPLTFASGLGFAAAVPGCILIWVRTGIEDDDRYKQYKWYIDYTKSVAYRLLPFIW